MYNNAMAPKNVIIVNFIEAYYMQFDSLTRQRLQWKLTQKRVQNQRSYADVDQMDLSS